MLLAFCYGALLGCCCSSGEGGEGLDVGAESSCGLLPAVLILTEAHRGVAECFLILTDRRRIQKSL